MLDLDVHTVQPLYNDHPWYSKKSGREGVGHYEEVKFIVKLHSGDIKTGCYREVAVVGR